MAGISLFSLVSCTTGISEKKLEKNITDFLEKKFPEQKVSVDCPKDIKAKEGDVFDCTAKVGQFPLVVTVTQNDGKGTVSWEVTKGAVEMTLQAGTEKLVKQHAENLFGLKDLQAKCPEKFDVGKDKTFNCTVEIDGVDVQYGISQQDDKGTVTFRPIGGVVVTEKLIVMIDAELRAKKISAHISCPKNMYVSKPGSEILCTAKDAKGVQVQIQVKVNDNNGNVDWQIIQNEPTSAAK